MFEHDILAIDGEGQIGGPQGAASRAICASIGNRDLRLERRVAAEQRRIVQRHAVVEDAAADAQNRLVVQSIARSEPRLDRVVVHL